MLRRARVFMYARSTDGTLIYDAGGSIGEIGGPAYACVCVCVKLRVRNARQAWRGQSLHDS